MTVTISERSTHAARRQAMLSRVTSVDAAAQSLAQALQDEPAGVDPDRFPLVVAAARALLNLVSGTGSGELHLLVDPDTGTAVRVRHDGSDVSAELVRVGPAAAAAGNAPDAHDGSTAAPPAPEPARPADVAPHERALRQDVREDIARRRARQAERAGQLRAMAANPAPARVGRT